jgi:hypothetical protein
MYCIVAVLSVNFLHSFIGQHWVRAPCGAVATLVYVERYRPIITKSSTIHRTEQDCSHLVIACLGADTAIEGEP